MNSRLEKYAREEIKRGLAKLDDDQRTLFKRMYSHNNLDKDMESVVDDMEAEKLDHALTLIDNTLE